MKTTTILTSTFIFFALNVNTFAMDTSDKLLNTIEANKNDITSVSIQNGRNQNVKTHQDNTDLQFAVKQNNETTFNAMLPKGRNVEAIVSNVESTFSYANTGRNKKIINSFVSMN